TGGGKGRDKHRVRKDPQGKRARQEERRKSGQQAEEREGRSGQSAARERGEERRKSGQQVEAREGCSGQREHPVTRLWSRKGVARTFGALAGFVLADLPVSRARVFGFLLAFCHVAPWLGCRGRWQPSEGGEQHRLRSR
ncbi:unnamed protein product, partial [Bubo scandiacus]